MEVNVMREEGYYEALYGLSLSYNQPMDKMELVAKKLCNKDGGHNKFLESMVVWLDIQAPRYWWQQFDTYRVGVTKQSESTMHTITKRPLIEEDFEGEIGYGTLRRMNTLIELGDFDQVKRELPEAFLQRRVVCTNYKALRHIIAQRKDHKLKEWSFFCAEVFYQLAYARFLGYVPDTKMSEAKE